MEEQELEQLATTRAVKPTNYILIFLESLIVLACILFFVNSASISVNVVHGESMQPTLCENDKGVTVSYDGQELSRYDFVIAAIELNGTNELIVKRLIGLPGDHVVIKNNCLYINGVETSEPYLATQMCTDDLDVCVPKDCYFLLGDNRSVSYDSRYFGCLPDTCIMGKFYPITHTQD